MIEKSTFTKIKELLDKENIEYRHLTHNHVSTSENAAKIRGTRLDQAAKALILKIELKNKNIEFVQIVIPANEKLDLKKVKKFLNLKNAALASPDEVYEKTGCTVGSIPPFGILWDICVYMDEEILKKEEIVFSAGTHTDSILLKAKDYFYIVKPTLARFIKENH